MASGKGFARRTENSRSRVTQEWTPELRGLIKRAKKLRNNNVAAMHLLVGRSGQPYTGSKFQSTSQRVQRKAMKNGVMAERFAFHDIARRPVPTATTRACSVMST